MYAIIATAFAALAAAAPTVINSAPVNLTERTDAPFGDKKGLAYNNGALTTVLSRANSATWAYNWGSTFSAPLFQQIPMYWGPGTGGNAANILAKIASGDTPWVLGYNEPDMTYANGGCQQTPQQAYDAWGNDMFQFYNKGAKLVCPAITSWDTTAGATGGPSGLTWLRDFSVIGGNNPSQFRCGAQALHWYGTQGQTAAVQAQAFIDYVAYANTQVTAIFGWAMPLWITEFSPLPVGDMNMMSDFLKITIPWLNAQSFIDRYSPFMADYFVTNGALNIGGTTFVNTM